MADSLAAPSLDSRALVSDSFRAALEACCANLERARSLVGDAVAQLLASFLNLRKLVDHQHGILISITDSLRQNGKSEGFTGATIHLVHEFVEQVVRVSHESMRIIDQLDTTGTHVDTIVEHADKIDDLARETRFIAMNARIETQRAGESGRTFKVVAEEVKRLAKASSELSVRIRREVSECHASLQTTHRTAAGLAGHDMTTAIESRGAIIGAIEKLGEVNTTLQETLVSVGSMVDDAVRALQFEDMVTQLLTDTVNRLRKLSVMSSEMFASPAVGRDSQRAADWSRELKTLGKTGSVSQASVDHGSVELF
ncbi:MAG TPA: methyl-accepting chemotaxis protein [Polyangiaceae bacterium]|nr:methyl-accepting chemotaxis protein [Polyangiaceae bacterium]